MCVSLHLLICTALRAHIFLVEVLCKINNYYTSLVFPSIYRQVPFFASNLELLGHSHVVSLFIRARAILCVCVLPCFV